MASLISLSDYKAQAGIAGTAQDTQLTALIAQASSIIRRYCSRDETNGFESAARTETYNGTGTDVLMLREWPVATIASITHIDDSGGTSVLPATSYRAKPNGYGAVVLLGSISARYAAQFEGAIYPNQFGYRPQFVPGTGNYSVVYTGGFATIPASLAAACASLVGLLQANAGTAGAFKSETLGQYSYTRGDKDAYASMMAMLGPWRLPA